MPPAISAYLCCHGEEDDEDKLDDDDCNDDCNDDENDIADFDLDAY